MAEALRNLQIFRNGAVITGKTIAEIKTAILSAISGDNPSLVVYDGEPISIRYIEKDDSTNTVKGIHGVAYVTDTEKKILWDSQEVTIDVVNDPADSFVQLLESDDEQGHFQLTVKTTTASFTEGNDVYYQLMAEPHTKITTVEYNNLPEEQKALYEATTEKVDGLVTMQDAKTYIDNLYQGSDAIEINDVNGQKIIAVKSKDDTTNILQITEDGLYVPNTGVTINNVQSIDLSAKTGTIYFNLDKTNQKWVVVETETETAISADGGHRYLVIITSDSKTFWVINDAGVTDHYIKTGVLTTKEVEEEGETVTKKIIQLTYNVEDSSFPPIEIDVTDLITVEGESDTNLDNTDYVNVKATTDSDNKVTLESSVKTVNLEDASVNGYVGPGEAGYDGTKTVAVGMYLIGNTAHTGTESVTTIAGRTYDNCTLVTEENLASLQAEYPVISDYFVYPVEANDGLATSLNVKEYIINHTTEVIAGDNVSVTPNTTTAGVKQYTVSVSDATVTTSEKTATVNPDKLTVSVEGVLNQDAMDVIETYIDNYDCGTFSLFSDTNTESASADSNTNENSETNNTTDGE